MSKYLYGASVQGIQEFIFETNKLKEIIGASELIKNIEKDAKNIFEKDKIIINAAGNIKVVFDSKNRAQEAIKNFMKSLRQKAVGITVSEAIVEFDGENPTADDFYKLEERLIEQRNRPEIPIDYKFCILKPAQRTARAVYEIKYDEEVDLSTYQKLNTKQDSSIELADLKNRHGKIAVIHADGNSLGSIVPKIANAGKLKDFSVKLNEATENAFKTAKKKFKQLREDSLFIREVILGGDDMTCIVNADYALEFVNEYLKNFEKQTKNLPGLNEIKKENLTACAGIAIVNEKYPVYYAVSLAEELCSIAKKESKFIDETNPPSSVKFYNLQSGNFQGFDLIKKNELEFDGISFDFGCYYINYDKRPLLGDFIKICELFEDDDSPKSKLREWLKSVVYNNELADLQLSRINEITKNDWKEKFNSLIKNFDEKLSLQNLIINGKTPVYDLIMITSNTDMKEKK